MTRRCARPSCSQPADATLTYNYAEGAVWLDGLAVDDHPMSHDLCDHHAANLRVPRGWRLDDRRALLAGATRPPASPALPSATARSPDAASPGGYAAIQAV
jgi:hypothetical protein